MRISDWSLDLCSSVIGLAIHDVDTIATALHLFGEVARNFDGRMICDGAQTFRVSDPGVGHVEMECICASLAHSFHQSFRVCVFFGAVEIGRASCRERVCQYV